ncbi:MAG TPA: DUF664 domain-containing protein [Microbacteriaceae bacterium]|nr:DUF664 domain-containing protein [Microbacteriaceae bacterium]
MNGVEALADGFGRISGVVHAVLDGISDEALTFRADPDANTVAWLVWHLARSQDAQVAHLVAGDAGAGAADAAGAWQAEGFGERFALPFGPGETGYGHTSAKVAAVRAPAGLLGEYYDAVAARTTAYVAGLADADLDRVIDTSWTPPVTVGVRLVSILADGLQHAGQAAFVRGVAQRVR